MDCVQEAAAREGMAPAAWAARVVLAAAKADGGPAPGASASETLQELIATRVQLVRVGNNNNQIARTRNSDGQVPDAVHDAINERVLAAVERVDEATRQVMRERR